MNPWDDVIGTEEQRAYAAAGFGRTSGLRLRPQHHLAQGELFDMGQKYADVLATNELLRQLREVA